MGITLAISCSSSGDETETKKNTPLRNVQEYDLGEKNFYHTRGVPVPQDGTLAGTEICGLWNNTSRKLSGN